MNGVGLLAVLPSLVRVYFLFGQLRVVRAFRSTVDDTEEKRSIHSVHSLHSLRSSRSHQGPRPLSDELLQSGIPGAGYNNRAMTHHNGQLTTKSRSAENIAMLASTDTTPAVFVEGPSNCPTPRTLSSSELDTHGSVTTHETTI